MDSWTTGIRWGSLKSKTLSESEPTVRSENSMLAVPSTSHYSCSLRVCCLSAIGTMGEVQEKGVQPNKRMTSSTRSIGELVTPLIEGWISLGETAGAHRILSLSEVLLHDRFALRFYLSLWGESRYESGVSLACLRKLLHSRGPPRPWSRPRGPPAGLLCLLFSTDDIMITEWLSETMLSVCPLLQLGRGEM